MKTTLSTVSNSRILVDTNILYYGNDKSSVNGKQSLMRMGELLSQKNTLHISGQIIREYTEFSLRNAAFCKLDLATETAKTIRNVARFRHQFNVIYGNEDVITQWFNLLPLLTTYKDTYDFYLAATMFVYNIPYIFTHNESDFTKFSDFITVILLFPK